MGVIRFFHSIFICLFITIIANQAEPIPNDIFSTTKVQSKGQENNPSLYEPALSEEPKTGPLIRRSPSFTKLNRRAPQRNRAAQKAAADLTAETKAVNRDLSIIESKKSGPGATRKAANDAIRQERAEDVARNTLSKAAGGSKNPVVVRANRAVKQNGPSLVVGGFKRIAKNPSSKSNVQSAIKQIDKGRVPVKAANQALIKAATGGRGNGGNSKPRGTGRKGGR